MVIGLNVVLANIETTLANSLKLKVGESMSLEIL